MPLCPFPVPIRLGSRVISETTDRNEVDDSVGLPITSSVQSHAMRFPRRDRDGCDAAESGESGFAPETLEVLAGGNKQLSDADGADLGQCQGVRCHG